MKMTKKTTAWVIKLENTEKTLPKCLDLKWMVVKKRSKKVSSRIFKTKVTNYLKCVELCKFMWPDVEDILTASTDKDCDINILPDPQMDWSSITAFD